VRSFVFLPYLSLFSGFGLVTGDADGLIAFFLYEETFNEAIPAYPPINWVNNRLDVVNLYILIPYAIRA
jgi:hypothetical protein